MPGKALPTRLDKKRQAVVIAPLCVSPTVRFFDKLMKDEVPGETRYCSDR